MKKLSIVLLALLVIQVLFLAPAFGKESDYRDVWCRANGGRTEVRFNDRTRCDCVTNTHAVEVDYANEWYQAIGQSLHYGLKAGKQPGILLIIRSPKDEKYLDRLQRVIEHHNLPITVWTVRD